MLQLISYRITLLGESPTTVSKLLKITIEDAQIAFFTLAHVYTSQQTGIQNLGVIRGFQVRRLAGDMRNISK